MSVSRTRGSRFIISGGRGRGREGGQVKNEGIEGEGGDIKGVKAEGGGERIRNHKIMNKSCKKADYNYFLPISDVRMRGLFPFNSS